MVDSPCEAGKPTSTAIIGIEYGLTIGSTAIAFYAWQDYVGLGLLTVLDQGSIRVFFFFHDARIGLRPVGGWIQIVLNSFGERRV